MEQLFFRTPLGSGKLLQLHTSYTFVNTSDFYEIALAVQTIFLRYEIFIKSEKIKVGQDVKFIVNC